MAIQNITRPSLELNIEWDKGSTFRYPILWTSGVTEAAQLPVDLSGATAEMQLRDIDTGVLLHSMTTQNNGINLEPPAYAPDQQGIIELHITDDDMAAFPWDFAVFDLDLFLANGETRKLVRGTFLAFNEITV